MPTRLVDGYSIEATPGQWRELGEHAGPPPGTQVYVPALPHSSSEETAAACAAIRTAGRVPVPHLAARTMTGRTALSEWLGRMQGAGARALLLIAGDRLHPAGPFGNTLAVLDSGLIERFGFRAVGVAGHPEGHPGAGDEELMTALRCKAAWARETGSDVWAVTQFAFSAGPVIRWCERMRREEIGLPVRIGVPGPASVGTLARFAAQCGVGASARLLMRRPGAVKTLLGAWAPDDMIAGLAGGLRADPALPATGLHVFPFGGLRRSVEFLESLRHHADAMQRTAANGG